MLFSDNQVLEFIIIMGAIIGQVFLPGFPKETLLLQAGIQFGLILGTILNWLGMVLAAQLAYEVVRRSITTGGKYSKLLEQYRDSKFLKQLEQRGNYGLFLIRLVPYAPNDVLSLLSGALCLPRKGFLIVSIITAIPFAVLFAYLGSVGNKFIDEALLRGINIAIMVISLTYMAIRTIINKRSSETTLLDGSADI